ncbi:GTP-binding protein [Acetobacterium paludosum]|uniref:GTP-binding protein n=1 Tax=Acetobacterium paludosum TaxID=52693 RepID=A0A923KR12_9FIRM|nr:GTP-binding protein [Acetobacterium paludosum]MBC3889699.1 GTP-binding protein [Acetobacterium paludosum]
MTTEVYIVSGFLGAGKTTLIQKILRETFKEDKVVLIENDFGEISVDSALLKSDGVEVKEINSGCICCSLQGDFVASIREIIDKFKPDKIIIEPSGIAKLSDIVKACNHSSINQHIKVKEKITVVDTEFFEIYLEDFGEFFEDQIKNADVILLSHGETFPDKAAKAGELIKAINPHAFVFSKEWAHISIDKILFCENNHKNWNSCVEHHECGGSEHHHHDAEEIFDTLTLFTKRIFTVNDLRERILEMKQIFQGAILRVKGIVSGENGYINLQYTLGDLQITETSAEGNFICIIGSNLDKQNLARIFEGY